jgi:hypothetical protein
MPAHALQPMTGLPQQEHPRVAAHTTHAPKGTTTTRGLPSPSVGCLVAYSGSGDLAIGCGGGSGFLKVRLGKAVEMRTTHENLRRNVA